MQTENKTSISMERKYSIRSVAVTDGIKIKFKNTKAAIEIRKRKSPMTWLHLFGLETDSSNKKLREIIAGSKAEYRLL
jgi:hypothetical protein